MFWLCGKFTPGPAFEAFAPHFERERALRKGYDALDENAPNDVFAAERDNWLAALATINALGLHVDGAPIRDFKLDSPGWCEFNVDS